jgi:phage gpG-like protein
MEGAHIAGVSEIQALLKGKILKADLAAVAIVRRAQAVVEANAKYQFTGSHAKGSPTTSSPGSPPDVVTGTLRRSIKSSRVQKGGFAEARGQVYPTAVYARIQELGGTAGRGSVLPARPYMAPSEVASRSRIGAIALEEWAKV